MHVCSPALYHVWQYLGVSLGYRKQTISPGAEYWLSSVEVFVVWSIEIIIPDEVDDVL